MKAKLIVYDANIIIDKCKAIGDINQPTQQRRPQPWSFTLRVLKPGPVIMLFIGSTQREPAVKVKKIKVRRVYFERQGKREKR